MPLSTTNSLTRKNILELYRRCLRSAQKIENSGQRATYLLYVRDGFRRHADLARNSREAALAYRDGLEQVEQMEYYQRMAKMKNSDVGSGAEVNPALRLDVATPSSPSPQRINKFPSSHPSNNQSSPHQVVSKWLLSVLPHIHEEDLDVYTQQLIDDGFDSVAFIFEELAENDLHFMKKAHKRVLMRQILEKRAE